MSVISQLGFVFADANLDDPGPLLRFENGLKSHLKNVKKHWAPRPKTDLFFINFC